MSQERVVRRRCLIRKRRIDGIDLSWFQELLDCRKVLSRFTQVLNEPEEDRAQYEGFIAQICRRRAGISTNIER
ncbi:unnamed protein product [Peronospora effusa]|nr:unnamed protein product [Peronospora effusa]